DRKRSKDVCVCECVCVFVCVCVCVCVSERDRDCCRSFCLMLRGKPRSCCCAERGRVCGTWTTGDCWGAHLAFLLPSPLSPSDPSLSLCAPFLSLSPSLSP